MVVMEKLVCKNCGKDRDKGRRLCVACNKQRLLAIARSKPRFMWDLFCLACGDIFTSWRKDSKLCKSCLKLKLEIASRTKSTNKYVMTNIPGHTQHRDIAQAVIGRVLHKDEVVHHVDDNPTNNSLSNLMVLSRPVHASLHQYLDLQRVILEKSKNENAENCWKTLIVPLTTAWLETTSAKVIKIAEIGQSAAEPRPGEGSETMHGAPNQLAAGDDIVQTATPRGARKRVR